MKDINMRTLKEAIQLTRGILESDQVSLMDFEVESLNQVCDTLEQVSFHKDHPALYTEAYVELLVKRIKELEDSYRDKSTQCQAWVEAANTNSAEAEKFSLENQVLTKKVKALQKLADDQTQAIDKKNRELMTYRRSKLVNDGLIIENETLTKNYEHLQMLKEDMSRKYNLELSKNQNLKESHHKELHTLQGVIENQIKEIKRLELALKQTEEFSRKEYADLKKRFDRVCDRLAQQQTEFEVQIEAKHKECKRIDSTYQELKGAFSLQEAHNQQLLKTVDEQAEYIEKLEAQAKHGAAIKAAFTENGWQAMSSTSMNVSVEVDKQTTSSAPIGRPVQVTNKQIWNLLNSIDTYARRVDSEGYGLPLFYSKQDVKNLKTIVRDWLKKYTQVQPATEVITHMNPKPHPLLGRECFIQLRHNELNDSGNWHRGQIVGTVGAAPDYFSIQVNSTIHYRILQDLKLVEKDSK